MPPQSSSLAQHPEFSPLSIARMIWKKKLLIVLVWVSISALTFVAVSRLPAIYKAEAVILVDSQKIPERYVSSTVVSDVQDRLASISKQILSSGQLQKIIEDFGLYRNQRKEHFQEEVVEMMRRDLEITPDRGWNGRTVAFRIAYQGPNASIVAQVANRLASLYVEENLKTREVQAVGTSEFMDALVKDAKKQLDEQEAAVSRYKLQHNGELPEQESSLNGILSRLQAQLEANRDGINRAHQSTLVLQNALSVAEDAVNTQQRALHMRNTSVATTPASGALEVMAGTIQPRALTKVEILRARLEELRLRYSDEHPEIKRLTSELANAEALEAAQGGEAPPPGPKPESKPETPRPSRPAAAPIRETPELILARDRVKSLRGQLALANQEIQNRQKEEQRILKDIAMYQARVNSLPVREQEMAQLTRDYEITKTNYRSLLDKKMAAEMATNMEQRQQAERFTIADPARVPGRPFKPKRFLLNAVGSVFGLVLGLALGLGKEFQKATLLGEWELPSDLTILGRLPSINIVASGRKGRDAGAPPRPSRLAIVSALVSLLGIIIAGVYFISHRL